MPQGYQIQNPSVMHYPTLQVIDWVDGFIRNAYAYVIMSNHIHWLVRAGHENLSEIFRYFKKLTARQNLTSIGNSGAESRSDWLLKQFEFAAQCSVRNSTHQFRTNENHVAAIFTDRFLRQK